jgi:hypothetical protein
MLPYRVMLLLAKHSQNARSEMDRCGPPKISYKGFDWHLSGAALEVDVCVFCILLLFVENHACRLNNCEPHELKYTWGSSGNIWGANKKLFTLLDLCVSSLRRGHANLLCIVPILTDDPPRESENEWEHG